MSKSGNKYKLKVAKSIKGEKKCQKVCEILEKSHKIAKMFDKQEKKLVNSDLTRPKVAISAS